MASGTDKSGSDGGGLSFIFLPAMLLRMLIVLVIFAVLVTAMVPAYRSVEEAGWKTRALAQAKGIGLALKLYASDHDNFYPAGTDRYGQPIRTANDAFRSLVPAYVQSESLFGNARSAYQSFPPDNVIVSPREILRAGENVYAYAAGLNDGMVPTLPLLADGTDGEGAGTYVSDRRARGGTWEGRCAIVVRLDQSGVMEPLAGPREARFIVKEFPDGTKRHLLGPAALAPFGLTLLDPAVADPPLPAANPAGRR